MPEVSIRGDVVNSTLVYGNDNFVLNLGEVKAGAVVNVFKPGGKPRYWKRPEPVVKMPLPFPILLGREKELDILYRAAQTATPVSLWARRGMGKTSIARNLTHTLNKQDPGGSIIYLDALGKGIDDLLQALFGIFFDCEPSFIPRPICIPEALQGVKALVFVDDLSLSSDEALSLLNAAPGCVFILISTEREIWGEGEILPLQGLPDDDGVKLFERELARPLEGLEREACRKICALLKCCPEEILRMAAYARENEIPLADLLAELQGIAIDPRGLANIYLRPLDETGRKIAALLAAAEENPVPVDLLKNIFKELDTARELGRLRTLALAQAHSPRYSLTGGLPSILASSWDLVPWQDSLLDHSIDWLKRQPAAAAVEESLAMLLHTLRSAAERRKWPEVIELGRLLENFLVYQKRLQAWRDVLTLVLEAARTSLDRSTEGWALHQLGSRALFLGELDEARSRLTEALDVRKVIRDKAGQHVTRHNLEVLNGLLPPGGRQGTPGARGFNFWLFGVIGIAALAVTVYALNTFQGAPQPPGEPYQPPPTRVIPTSNPPTHAPPREPTKIPPREPTPVPKREPTKAPPPTKIPPREPESVPSLQGTVLELANCRYGPGAPYLYKYGLKPGSRLEAIGRDADGNWLQVQAIGGRNPCWVNARLMQMDGDQMRLRDTYPYTNGLPISPFFERITITSTSRDGNWVTVEWVEHIIRSDLRQDGVPAYIVEVWSCVDGRPAFNALGTDDTSASFQIDEGCGQPVHADLIGQDKEGFSHPAEIPLK